MAATSFADRVRRERATNMFLVRSGGSPAAWYYLLVDPGKKAAFRKAATGPFNLTDYGQIVASGYGANPPDAVRERMKTEYGFTGE